MKTMLQKGVTYLQGNVWYSLGIALLAVVSLLMVLYEIFVPSADPEFVARLHFFDIIIACIFLTDFFAGFWLNTELTKRQYWRYNWLNLVSSIPVTSDVTRVLRILRILRAFRVIRAATNLWFTQSRYRRNRHNLTR